MAALASALMPSLSVAGVRSSVPGDTPDRDGIDHAVIQDVTGKLYDVCATDTEAGRTLLASRVKAAHALASAREPGGLGFAMERVVAFTPGEGKDCPTGSTAVMVIVHQDGIARTLDSLTLDDCASLGTAIGAIHRLNPAFLAQTGYPAFSTGQIRAQLVAWIKRLRIAGHVPAEITSSWARIVDTEGLWSFSTCMVHGGFADGDVKFSGSTVTAVNHWSDMQVNDPARDLGWIFSRLDEDHRNAVLTAYGRMMGNRLDDLIMLRANLWVQMEQVGDFIQALNRADTDRIVQFRAQVDRLAHQLGVVAPAAARAGAAGGSTGSAGAGAGAGANAASSGANGATGSNGASNAERASEPPSTLTVGTLLQADARRQALLEAEDATNDSDRTGSVNITTVGANASVSAPTAAAGDTTGQAMSVSRASDAPITAATIALGALTAGTGSTGNWDDATADRLPAKGAGPASEAGVNGSPANDAAAVIDHAVDHDDTIDGDDTSQSLRAGVTPAEGAQENVSHAGPETATIAIPLLEREEQALRDAQAGLETPDRITVVEHGQGRQDDHNNVAQS